MAVRVGDRVQRDLDGLLFEAIVTARHDDGTVDVRYTDDGNIEKDVDVDEIEVLEAGGGDGKEGGEGKECGVGGGGGGEGDANDGGGKEGDESKARAGSRSLATGGDAALVDDAPPVVVMHTGADAGRTWWQGVKRAGRGRSAREWVMGWYAGEFTRA